MLRKSLRVHPDLLVLAEMRGKAVDVVESARTGHTVLTSLTRIRRQSHTRILSMYQMATTSIPPQVICPLSATPSVMVFKRQMADGYPPRCGGRGALGVEDGGVRTRTLYRYDRRPAVARVHPIRRRWRRRWPKRRDGGHDQEIHIGGEHPLAT